MTPPEPPPIPCRKRNSTARRVGRVAGIAVRRWRGLDRRWRIGIVLVVAALALGLSLTSRHDSERLPLTFNSDASDAVRAAINWGNGFVTQYLRDPGECDYCRHDDLIVTRHGDVYTVSGWVDTPEPFGSIRRKRHSFVCRMRLDREQHMWYREQVTIDP